MHVTLQIVGFFASVVAHKCIHDDIAATTSVLNHVQTYLDDDNSNERRLLDDTSTYAPIRIIPHYDMNTMSALDAKKSDYLMQKIVPAAVNFWQNALSVIPIQGNLFAAPTCTSSWVTSPPVCASVAPSSTCVEMTIPSDHTSPLRVCSTCRSAGCSSSSSDCTTIGASNTGIPNADIVMYIRAVTTSDCSGSTLAYAAACQRDQYDRPIFAMINFCPNTIDASQSSGVVYEKLVAVAIHEFGHVLGFSSSSYPLMRNADGTPRTARVGGGLTGTPVSGTASCNDGTTGIGFLPSDSTVEYIQQRGHSVALINTPTVKHFVQNHFNCTSLRGAEIENNDGGCLGSHWEERLFGSEVMTPVVNYRNTLSALTLAYFEDTGWYQANFSMAKPFYLGSNQGCSIATENCVQTDVNGVSTPSNADDYCTESGEKCSADGLSRSYCSLRTDYANGAVPAIYQYFSSQNKGGSSVYGDYCPRNVAYSQGDCMEASNLAIIPGTDQTPFGEKYTSNSYCTLSTLRRDQMYGYTYSSRAAGCYSMRCAQDTVSNRVTVLIDITTNVNAVVTVNCTRKGQQVTVPGFSGVLTCPDPFLVCGLGTCSTPCGSRSMCVNGNCVGLTPTITPSLTSAAPQSSSNNSPTTIAQVPTTTTTIPTTTTAMPKSTIVNGSTSNTTFSTNSSNTTAAPNSSSQPTPTPTKSGCTVSIGATALLIVIIGLI